MIDTKIEKTKDSISDLNSLAHFINQSFSDEESKCRGIFKWISFHIDYDINSMYTLNFKASKQDVLGSLMKDKKAICLGYSYLFDTLCKLTQINSVIITGSTKQSWFPEPAGHAWNAVKINNKWSLVDVTWGSGSLLNKKFVRKINDKYFIASGKDLSNSHHPIDPIWQLMEYPISLDNFYNPQKKNITQGENKWNYEDSITTFLTDNYTSQLKSQQRRLKENGTNSSITSDYYIYLENSLRKVYYDKYKVATKHLNNAIDEYNTYIEFKNHQFSPSKPDEEIEKMIPDIEKEMEWYENISLELSLLENEDINNSINQNAKNINELKKRLNEEKSFVSLYLSTKKNNRRDLFYKKTYTLFGIPIK